MKRLVQLSNLFEKKDNYKILHLSIFLFFRSAKKNSYNEKKGGKKEMNIEKSVQVSSKSRLGNLFPIHFHWMKSEQFL